MKEAFLKEIQIILGKIYFKKKGAKVATEKFPSVVVFATYR